MAVGGGGGGIGRRAGSGRCVCVCGGSGDARGPSASAAASASSITLSFPAHVGAAAGSDHRRTPHTHKPPSLSPPPLPSASSAFGQESRRMVVLCSADGARLARGCRATRFVASPFPFSPRSAPSALFLALTLPACTCRCEVSHRLLGAVLRACRAPASIVFRHWRAPPPDALHSDEQCGRGASVYREHQCVCGGRGAGRRMHCFLQLQGTRLKKLRAVNGFSLHNQS